MNRGDPGVDYFARLEAALAAGTGRGDHLTEVPRRIGRGARRAAAAAMLVLVLAFSLVSEFPASARGQVTVAAAAASPPARGA